MIDLWFSLLSDLLISPSDVLMLFASTSTICKAGTDRWRVLYAFKYSGTTYIENYHKLSIFSIRYFHQKDSCQVRVPFLEDFICCKTSPLGVISIMSSLLSVWFSSSSRAFLSTFYCTWAVGWQIPCPISAIVSLLLRISILLTCLTKRPFFEMEAFQLWEVSVILCEKKLDRWNDSLERLKKTWRSTVKDLAGDGSGNDRVK